MSARLEDVLAAHRVNYHSRNIGGETSATLRYTSCEGCEWQGGHHDEAGWEAHLAGIIRLWILSHRGQVAAEVRNAMRVGPIGQNSLQILAAGGTVHLTGTEADLITVAALAALTGGQR